MYTGLYFIVFCLVESSVFFFFFNETATPEIYTLSLHDALPISPSHPAESTETQTGPVAQWPSWPDRRVLGERGPVRHVAVWHRRGRWLSRDPSVDPDDLGLRVRAATGWGTDPERPADRHGGSTGTRW